MRDRLRRRGLDGGLDVMIDGEAGHVVPVAIDVPAAIDVCV